MTARLHLTRFIAEWPYEPEDLADDTGPQLAVATLPRRQRVADLLPHERFQPIGEMAQELGLRGVRSRSAQTPHGAGREVAWFPATRRSRAHLLGRQAFTEWFWG